MLPAEELLDLRAEGGASEQGPVASSQRPQVGISLVTATRRAMGGITAFVRS